MVFRVLFLFVLFLVGCSFDDPNKVDNEKVLMSWLSGRHLGKKEGGGDFVSIGGIHLKDIDSDPNMPINKALTNEPKQIIIGKLKYKLMYSNAEVIAYKSGGEFGVIISKPKNRNRSTVTIAIGRLVFPKAKKK